MDKKKPDLLKFVGEEAPIITEELTDIDSLVSATEYTGMGKVFPSEEDEELNEVFDIAEHNEERRREHHL